jgi:hypothetical protein
MPHFARQSLLAKFQYPNCEFRDSVRSRQRLGSIECDTSEGLSWLNLIEGFFSKFARSVLRHIPQTRWIAETATRSVRPSPP